MDREEEQIAQAGNSTTPFAARKAAEPLRVESDEFDTFLECGILADGLLRLRRGDCSHDKLVAFSCKRRGICPTCGARRMAQTAAHLVDHAWRVSASLLGACSKLERQKNAGAWNPP